MKQLDWTEGALENPTGSPILGAIARTEGLDDNISFMLADSRAHTKDLRYVEDLLQTVYGPEWLPALEAAAKKNSAKRTKGKPNV